MTTWGRHNDADEAVDRILNAAGLVHQHNGIRGTTMAHVASAAGCSRATLYLYFANRSELRAAVRNRAALLVARQVAEEVAAIDDPVERLAESAVRALHHVRTAPDLAAWFDVEAAGMTHDLATSSEVVNAIALGVAGDVGIAAADADRLARPLVRLIVSYLISPDPDHEGDSIRLLVSGAIQPHLRTARKAQP